MDSPSVVPPALAAKSAALPRSSASRAATATAPLTRARAVSSRGRASPRRHLIQAAQVMQPANLEQQGFGPRGMLAQRFKRGRVIAEHRARPGQVEPQALVFGGRTGLRIPRPHLRTADPAGR